MPSPPARFELATSCGALSPTERKGQGPQQARATALAGCVVRGSGLGMWEALVRQAIPNIATDGRGGGGDLSILSGASCHQPAIRCSLAACVLCTCCFFFFGEAVLCRAPLGVVALLSLPSCPTQPPTLPSSTCLLTPGPAPPSPPCSLLLLLL